MENMKLKPTVVSNPHPLIGDGRLYYYEKPKEGETLGQYVERVGIKLPKGSLVVLINGAVAMHDWRQYVVKTGDDIIFRSSALGRGGGGKVLRIVAMVVVAVIAAYTGGAAASLYTGMMSKVAGAVASSVVMIAGTMLVNAILPPPKPQVPSTREKEQSPTYGISAGRNQMNTYGPMILVFGRHKVVPFLASKPYTTFSGDDQYLSQAFHFGLQPDLRLEQMRIGDTDINNYHSVVVNRSLHDGKLSLISGNVDVLEGFELSSGTGWVQRITPKDTTHISADLAANLYNISDRGDEWNMGLTVEAQYRKVGETRWRPLGGHTDMPATHYWSLGRFSRQDAKTTVWQQVRYGSIRPDEHREGEVERICHKELRMTRKGRQEEVEVCEEYTWKYIPHPASSRKKSVLGAMYATNTFIYQGAAPDPYSGYEGTGITQIKGNRPQTPTRITIETEVERGQYEIRFKKISGDVSGTRQSNKCSIAQIRCTQVDETDYTGQLRLAVRIKATSQLNGAIDTFSAVASAKCPVWNGSAWEEQETSNPAWWFLWWARGKRDVNYRRLYGECLPDNRIDIEAIKEWAKFCERKKLTFNWVLDRKMNVEEVYYTIARAGRASSTWQTGKRGVIWDSDSLPVTTLLTPANIIAGSFSYKTINTDVADEIIVNFFDEKKNWEKSSVRQIVPHVQQTNNPVTLDLEGCTSEEQAGREANLLAASQHYHRKQYSFEMDIEGAVLARGDVAQLTHDLTSYAAGGRVIAVDTVKGIVTIDSEVQRKGGSWLSLRDPFNRLHTVRVNANGNKMTVLGGWKFGEVDKPEDWLWQYDPVKTPGIKLQIKSVVPQSSGNVKFEAIEYVPDYFKSEKNLYTVSKKELKDLPAIRVLDTTITERVVDETNGATQMTVSWVMSERSSAYVMIIDAKTGATLLNRLILDNKLTFEANEGDLISIEIRPTANNRIGLAYTRDYVVIGTQVAIVAPENLQVIKGVDKTTVQINWDRVVNAVGYEVQVITNNQVRRTLNIGNVLTYSYGVDDMMQDGGLVRSVRFGVRALGRGRAKSEQVFVESTNPQIGALQGIEMTPNVKSVAFNCQRPEEEDFKGFLYWISDRADFVPTLENVYLDTVSNQVFFEHFNQKPLEAKRYYIWCAGYDVFGKDSLNISGSFVVEPLALELSPQSISAEMIKNGALNADKFSQELKITKVVNALPAISQSKKGDQVFLTTDNKVYRFDGRRWTSEVDSNDVQGVLNISKIPSVPTNKLTGLIGSSQIQNVDASKLTGNINIARVPSIPTTKLSGTIRANQIATNAIGANHISAGAITADKIQADAVTADKIQANAITSQKIVANAIDSSKLAANSVTAGHLQANSVTAGKISAGAVGADQIQANSISAKHLLVGDLSNLVLNGNQQYGLEGFSGNIALSSPDSGSPTGKALICKGRDHYYGNEFAVSGGEVYYFKFRAYRHGQAKRIGLGLYLLGKDRTQRTWLLGAEKEASASQNWAVYEGFVTIPSWAVTGKVFIQVLQNNNESVTHAYITGIEARRVNGATMIQDGTILTQHVRANSLNGDRIAGNTLHGDKVVANSLHGDKVTVNTMNGNRIITRSITADKLMANTITANSGVIANGAIQAAQIGTAAIKTAHIEDLSVDTLKIKDGAITRIISYEGKSNDATINIPLTQGGMVTVFVKTDAQTYLMSSYNAPVNDKRYFLKLFVDGVLRKTTEAWSMVVIENERTQSRSNYFQEMSLIYSFYCEAGTHSIRALVERRGVLASPLSIVAMGAMR